MSARLRSVVRLSAPRSVTVRASWPSIRPVSVRPFYHMRKEDDPDLTKSFDLIASGLEITTGAQREHRPEVLSRQALEKGLLVVHSWDRRPGRQRSGRGRKAPRFDDESNNLTLSWCAIADVG